MLASLLDQADPSRVRLMETSETGRLIGDTINLSPDEWLDESRLFGWSRARIAAHIARGADAIRVLLDSQNGLCRLYASDQQRDAEIEAAATQEALDLQIDLDTSASKLSEAFSRLDSAGWRAEVRVSDTLKIPVNLLPLARLREVVLHHVDLDCGYDFGDIEQRVADLLARWQVFLASKDHRFPAMRVRSTEGMDAVIGRGEPTACVCGSSGAIFGWLTGRSSGEDLQGCDEIEVPTIYRYPREILMELTNGQRTRKDS